MTLNEDDTLYFEKATGLNENECMDSQNQYAINIDYQMAVGMGAKFETNYLFGLSERESSLLLSETYRTDGTLSGTDPYRFFNIDYYMHQKDDPRGEYGSIPYVTGHNKQNDASILWVNSADSWTDLVKSKSNDKMYTNFVSESG